MCMQIVGETLIGVQMWAGPVSGFPINYVDTVLYMTAH